MKLTNAESRSLTEVLKENARLAAELAIARSKVNNGAMIQIERDRLAAELAKSERYEEQNHHRILELESVIKRVLAGEAGFWPNALRKVLASSETPVEGRECGACGHIIPPGGSSSCSLDHAVPSCYVVGCEIEGPHDHGENDPPSQAKIS